MVVNMEMFSFQFLSTIGFNIWIIWLLFTGAVWLTFLAVRFWVRLIRRMSVFDLPDE